MDVLTHILLGINVSTFANTVEEKAIILVGSIVPDIGEIFIQRELNRKFGTNLGVYDERTSDISIAINVKITWIYDLLHSPTFYMILLLGNLFFECNYILWLSISGLFHIMLDFATHGKVWALKFFFPFSNKRFPIFDKIIGNWWEWKPQFNIPFTKINLPKYCLIFWLFFTLLSMFNS